MVPNRWRNQREEVFSLRVEWLCLKTGLYSKLQLSKLITFSLVDICSDIYLQIKFFLHTPNKISITFSISIYYQNKISSSENLNTI